MKSEKAVAPDLDVSARLRVRAAASQLFTQRGYAATSVREIVEAAGVTKPILYYYYGSKEGVYLKILEEGLEAFNRTIEECRHFEGSAREKILHLADQTFGLFCEHIDVGRLMQAIYYGPPQGAPFFDFEVFHVKFIDMVKELVQQGIKNREFRRGDVEQMSWTIVAAINLANELELVHPDKGLGAQGLAKILGLVFSGIARQNKQSNKAGGRKR